jgi:nitroreductase
MRTFLQGAVLATMFVAANVVGAGVVLVLGLMLQAIAPAWQSPWPWFVVCAAGVGAALTFLKGALVYAQERARVQCRSDHRGG